MLRFALALVLLFTPASAPAIEVRGAGSVITQGYTAAQIIVDVAAPGDALHIIAAPPYFIEPSAVDGQDLVSCGSGDAPGESRCVLRPDIPALRLTILALAKQTCEPALLRFWLESEPDTQRSLIVPAPCAPLTYRQFVPLVAR